MERSRCPALIVFGGRPGTGKTTASCALSRRLGAAWLRIDAIEQALKAAGIREIGPAGYAVANALAEANLRLGLTVVADCVNPVAESREAWAAVAARAAVRLVEVELVCSDRAEHRRRVEGRTADIPGHALPTWEAVTRHEYESWTGDHLILDTAAMPAAEVVDRVETCALGSISPQR